MDNPSCNQRGIGYQSTVFRPAKKTEGRALTQRKGAGILVRPKTSHSRITSGGLHRRTARALSRLVGMARRPAEAGHAGGLLKLVADGLLVLAEKVSDQRRQAQPPREQAPHPFT